MSLTSANNIRGGLKCPSDRGRSVMHDGMPYDLIQGQGQGHGASEVPTRRPASADRTAHRQFQSGLRGGVGL